MNQNGGSDAGKLEKLLEDRLELLENKLALLEECQPVIEQEEIEAFEIEVLEGTPEELKGRLTLHMTLKWWKRDNGYFYDHKWYSFCDFTGYVTDVSGNIVTWNHVEVGYNRGCTAKYPTSEVAERDINCTRFGGTAVLRPKVDHWSGWVECRNNKMVAHFSWKTSNCPR